MTLDTIPHAAITPVSLGQEPIPYISGLALVTLQKFTALAFEIGETAAPPVGVPTVANTLYSGWRGQCVVQARAWKARRPLAQRCIITGAGLLQQGQLPETCATLIMILALCRCLSRQSATSTRRMSRSQQPRRCR